MINARYKYEVEYFVTDTTGKHNKKREVEFTKPREKWEISNWDRLAEYLRLLEKSKNCDISVVGVEPI